MKNLYLVGFMGTGKTGVGRLLAHRCGRVFIDLDDRIETREGTTITDIFTQSGEAYFRNLEKTLLQEVSGGEQQVIACGGGIVIDAENISVMKQTGRIICVTARPEIILKRTRGHGHRPLLNVEHPEQKIAELLKARAVFYAQAAVTIDTSDLSIEEVVDRIVQSEDPK